MFAAFAEVIERVGDGRLRVYLYHFPQMSGVSLTPALIERLLARYPDSVAGMKDSSGDLANMAANRQAVSRLRRVQRLRRTAVAAAPRRWRRLHHRRGQRRRFDRRSGVRGMARRRRGRGRAGPDEAHRHPRGVPRRIRSSAALKEIVARNTGRARWRILRPPLVPLFASDAEALAGALDNLGFAPAPVP